MASGEREAEGATDETAVSLDIPEFITIVAEQVREAVRRFERTGHAPLLYLSGLQLQVAFTAEESSDRNGKIELKPWIVSLSRGKKETQSQQVVHSVTLNLTTGGTAVAPPFTGEELDEATFPLFLEFARELRTKHQGAVLAGPETELVRPFYIRWRGQDMLVEVRRRLAKRLLEAVETIETLRDVADLYDGALSEVVFVPQPELERLPPVGAF